MIKHQDIRKVVKLHLKNRDYVKAIESLEPFAADTQLKKKIHNNLSAYQNLEKELNSSNIDNTSFFYGINKMVLDILDITDEITGNTDNDWDFIDELNSTLKFNLVDSPNSSFIVQEEKHTINDIESSNTQKIESQDNELKRKKEEKIIKDNIRKLITQLHKYEEIELTTPDAEEKKKYRSIIEAINSQILGFSKKLRELNPEK